MSKTITLLKVLYKDQEFSIIPKGAISTSEMIQMQTYLREVGDIVFVIDNELYFDENGYFNLSMKYREEYVFI
ncbi:hypothetical protein DQT32_04625 [Salmonella enterica subsp. enterica serovar Braenderup]|nr:hypothetical protein [Salmonella enterica subsp. enterica serovar Braenderup]